MKFFSKEELKVLFIILTAITLASFYNFRIALRRARDVQRRADIDLIHNALSAYQADYGFFPPSDSEGRIIACKGEKYDEVVGEMLNENKIERNLYFEGLADCEWYFDGLVNLESREVYLEKIPGDPRNGQGIRYRYISNTNRFQLYAFLEGESEEEGFRDNIVGRTLGCGTKICNFGKAYGESPLDKSLEEYENELLQSDTNIQITPE